LEYIYRLHAIERMFQRNISEQDIESVVDKGTVIESYSEDKPYPSFLALGHINNMALHVVYAIDEHRNIIIITTYYPDPKKWDRNFKIRKV